MADVEFVDRKQAEKDAARAIKLLNESDESKVEAWFAMQAVADQVGARSNVGVRGISWDGPRDTPPRNKRGLYRFKVYCVDGILQTTTGAPATLSSARRERYLGPAKQTLDRLVAERGGLKNESFRPSGLGHALLAAVSASEEGQLWLARTKERSALGALRLMVKVADTYRRDGVYPPASLSAHAILMPFDTRHDLIREFTSTTEALGKALSLRQGAELAPAARLDVPRHMIAKHAGRTGLDTQTSRALLRGAMSGYSRTRLYRGVNEAIKMVEQPDLRVAA